MPVHDWSHVSDGAFNDFHGAWISALRNVLNERVLPAGFSACSERRTDHIIPDVLALDWGDVPDPTDDPAAVAVIPTARIKGCAPRRRSRRRVVIRYHGGRRVVAIIEVVSASNKSRRRGVGEFVRKATEAINDGVHFLMIDVLPPTQLIPNGLHAPIWAALARRRFALPEGEPLSAVSYVSGDDIEAYIEPFAVGQAMPDMSLCLTGDLYVTVPLEDTYRPTFAGTPRDVVYQLTAP